MRNNSSEGDFFSKHFELIHLSDLGVLKHFSTKLSFLSSLLSVSLLLFSPLFFFVIFSFIFS